LIKDTGYLAPAAGAGLPQLSAVSRLLIIDWSVMCKEYRTRRAAPSSVLVWKGVSADVVGHSTPAGPAAQKKNKI